MAYGLLADVVLAVHLAYLSYAVFGQVLIWLGWTRRWLWVRNPWFRWTHLFLMGIVGGEALLNLECPLTGWERQFRQLAGQEVSGEPFLGRLLHNLTFMDWPLWALNSLQAAFALAALGTFVLAPPRRETRGPFPFRVRWTDWMSDALPKRR